MSEASPCSAPATVLNCACRCWACLSHNRPRWPLACFMEGMGVTVCTALRLQMLGIQASVREVQEVCVSAGHNGELSYLDFVGVGVPLLLLLLHTVVLSPVQAAPMWYCAQTDGPQHPAGNPLLRPVWTRPSA